MPQTYHHCQCPRCQQKEPHPDKESHAQLNLLLSRLHEQQRRWFVAYESNRSGHPTDLQLSEITGIDPTTIRRGREELAQNLEGRPVDRVRVPGGGRPLAEEKDRKS